MKPLDFEALLTFWTLKGSIQHYKGLLGIKKVGGVEYQTKRMYISNKKSGSSASITYSKVMANGIVYEYELNYADITINGISTLHRGKDVIDAIQQF